MLSMNGILVVELLLGAALMGLIFVSFADTDLIADSASKPKHKPESEGLQVRNKPEPGANRDLLPDVHERVGG